MKKIIITLSLLMISQGMQAITDEVKSLKDNGLTYPQLLLIRRSGVSDDLLKQAFSRFYHAHFLDYNKRKEAIEKALVTVRNLSEADLAVLKTEYEQEKAAEQAREKEWSDQVKKWEQEAKQAAQIEMSRVWTGAARRDQMRQRFKEKRQDVERRMQEAQWRQEDAIYAAKQAEAKKPEILAVINGFIDTWGGPAIKEAQRNVIRVFIAQWKTKLDAQQQAKLQQIMDLMAQEKELGRKFKGDWWAMRENEEYQKIHHQLEILSLPYLAAFREYSSTIHKENVTARLLNYLPAVARAVAEEFKKGK
jgi:hypothetical protein